MQTVINTSKLLDQSKISSGPRSVEIKGHLCFDRLANQHVNKVVKEGFSFNIMCIGETGVGKSTLIDTLFNTQFNFAPSNHNNEKVSLNKNTFELRENNIDLKLTIIETCGYGDQINKENSHEEIVNYINEQYESYVQEELNLKRNFKQVNDKRVHLCLYFISPTGHSLKAIDLKTMKALDRKVNIIPIIAKADTICKNELILFKKRIMQEINNNNVLIYQFPVNDYESSVNKSNTIANGLFPLAVIGSNELVKIGNKLTKGRQYEWGTVSIENESHCDFVKLKEMILSTNMLDLIELTHVKHYQLYRANRLREIGFCDEEEEEEEEREKKETHGNNNYKTIQDVFNLKRAELNEEIQRRELEIKEEFIKRVKEKELKIRESEKELNIKYNNWKQEQNEWRDRIEEKRRDLEEQMREFSERKFSLDKLKLSTLSSVGKSSKKK